MKPDWNKLGAKYQASSSVVIGDADCTVETDLCKKFDVKGYPTIKYFDGSDPEGSPYQGGRDYESLEKFVVDTLEKGCVISELDDCTEKEQKYITKFSAKGAEAVEKELKRLDGMKAKKMKATQKEWLLGRLNILKQLQQSPEASEGKEEL